MLFAIDVDADGNAGKVVRRSLLVEPCLKLVRVHT
jgi:hypothetical protein